MQLHFERKRFFVSCAFNEREIPQRAGFRWCPIQKHWYAEHLGIASRLRDYADEKAEKELTRKLLTLTPWTGAIPYPKGLTPKPFQIETAVPFALARNRSYLALDPGLGKTICAALISNALGTPAFYIHPPFMRNTVLEELLKWTTNFGSHLFGISDSVLDRPQAISELEKELRQIEKLKKPKLLIVDEAHRFKNSSAQRTKTLFRKYVPLFDKVVFMSGTPLPNRPMELFSVLSQCAPETIGFKNKLEFGLRYCGAYQNEWGWDFSGASHMEELAQNVLGKFMLRIKAKDVFTMPYTEEFVFIGDKLPAKVASHDKALLRQYSPEDLLKAQLNDPHIATYRKELGMLKVKDSLPFIKSILEDTEEAVLLFAHHKMVIEEYAKALSRFKPLLITGSTPVGKRHSIEKQFQTCKENRLMILNLQAGGIGFTFTKASRVLIAEPSWVPAENEQAWKRAHRIGQKNHVLVQYLVYKNSLDRSILESNFAKKRTSDYV